MLKVGIPLSTSITKSIKINIIRIMIIVENDENMRMMIMMGIVGMMNHLRHKYPPLYKKDAEDEMKVGVTLQLCVFQ